MTSRGHMTRARDAFAECVCVCVQDGQCVWMGSATGTPPDGRVTDFLAVQHGEEWNAVSELGGCQACWCSVQAAEVQDHEPEERRDPLRAACSAGQVALRRTPRPVGEGGREPALAAVWRPRWRGRCLWARRRRA